MITIPQRHRQTDRRTDGRMVRYASGGNNNSPVWLLVVPLSARYLLDDRYVCRMYSSCVYPCAYVTLQKVSDIYCRFMKKPSSTHLLTASLSL